MQGDNGQMQGDQGRPPDERGRLHESGGRLLSRNGHRPREKVFLLEKTVVFRTKEVIPRRTSFVLPKEKEGFPLHGRGGAHLAPAPVGPYSMSRIAEIARGSPRGLARSAT